MTVHGVVMGEGNCSATSGSHRVEEPQQPFIAESKNQRKKRLRQEAYLKKKVLRTELRRQKRKNQRLLTQDKEKSENPSPDSAQSPILTAHDVPDVSNGLSDAPTSSPDAPLKVEVLLPPAPISRPSRREQHVAEFAARCQNNPIVIIDCDFKNMQTPRELVSLAQQLMYTYGTNRRLSEPFRLVMCGLFPELLEVLQRVSGFSSWQCICTSKSVPDYLGWSPGTPESLTDNGATANEFLGTRTQCVYLTADSERVLRDALSTDKIYIIGGLVDRNRYPGITSARAKEWNISSASLPIREHCSSLSGSKVLTVNQVFSILGSYANTREWRTALDAAIPSRKQKVTIPPTANSSCLSETSNSEAQDETSSQTDPVGLMLQT